MSDIEEVIGPQGLLANALEGYRYRHQQHQMAEAVAEVINSGGVMICEAGTGTGKTFAYLVPALLSGRKVIISTGTRNLQDQLYDKDLPLVKEVLGTPVKTALLKGRANYLCPHRLQIALDESPLQPARVQRELRKIENWANRTRRGDIAELPGIPEDSMVWPLITSTNDNCLGQECPSYDDCHLLEARRRAFEADLVVINHHLLCADFALKADGFGELLPEADCMVVDEAHQLPDTASNFFGFTLSGRQLLDLVRDVNLEYQREAGDVSEIPEQCATLESAVRELRLAFGQDSRRGAWSEVAGEDHFNQTLEELAAQLEALGGLLEGVRERGKGLESCADRCKLLIAGLRHLMQPEAGEDVRWFETFRTTFRLNRTPLSIAERFAESMKEAARGWVFTSATLAVGESFKHFQDQLGLDGARTEKWDSPFDYPNQALWFVPRGLPLPSAPEYTAAVVDTAAPLLEASHGRAFMLFTSYRALNIAAEMLAERIAFPLLVQGEAPKGELLARFRELGNAVLLGTAAFWEGVDVRGDALSCVIIDKLPFASPGDPVLQARIDAVRKKGGNPFNEFQLPHACITLKQGAGRLIRDVSDRGLLVVCDPRLLKKRYGYTFLDSMPPMARTRDPEEAVAFFNQNATQQ
jgi:ATP-dependent DNA helicase DinG